MIQYSRFICGVASVLLFMSASDYPYARQLPWLLTNNLPLLHPLKAKPRPRG